VRWPIPLQVLFTKNLIREALRKLKIEGEEERLILKSTSSCPTNSYRVGSSTRSPAVMTSIPPHFAKEKFPKKKKKGGLEKKKKKTREYDEKEKHYPHQLDELGNLLQISRRGWRETADGDCHLLRQVSTNGRKEICRKVGVQRKEENRKEKLDLVVQFGNRIGISSAS